MCKQFETARDTVIDFINNSDPFSLKEVHTKILDNGGALLVSSNTNVRQYLNRFEDSGQLTYNATTQKYQGRKK